MQKNRLIITMLVVYVLTFVVLVGVAVLSAITGRPVWFFTSDPFVLGHLPFYAGILSNIGILLWCSTAAICFFSALTLENKVHTGHWKQFLWTSGFLTSLLLFDDLFQLHRIFYLKYMRLTTVLVYFTYGLFVVYYLNRFKKQIWQTDYLLLVLALGFFALAVVFDTMSLLPRGGTASSDGLKLFGIVSWFTYFVRTCAQVPRYTSISNENRRTG
jgi:hypothetical protein